METADSINFYFIGCYLLKEQETHIIYNNTQFSKKSLSLQLTMLRKTVKHKEMSYKVQLIQDKNGIQEDNEREYLCYHSYM